MTPSRAADPATAAARLEKARQFAGVAALLFDDASGTATHPDADVATAHRAHLALLASAEAS